MGQGGMDLERLGNDGNDLGPALSKWALMSTDYGL